MITEAEIKELATIVSENGPIVSCYLDVDGRRQLQRSDVLRRMSAMAKEAVAAHPDHDLSADLDRMTAHVEREIDRHGVRGLAMFSSVASGLWHAFPLPSLVPNRITVNRSPALAPLEAIVHELAPLAVLLVDRQRARLFVFRFGEVIEHTELFESLPREYNKRDDMGRGTREREQHHVDELALQHLRHAHDVAFAYFRDHGFGHLTIGATDDVHAAIEPLLHPYLKERLAPRIRVAAAASEAEIAEAARVVEREIQQRHQAAVVAHLRDAAGAGTKAVLGLAPVLGALNERRVATLVVSADYVETGWECACGALAAKGPTCPVDGAEMVHVNDVVADAVDVALREGARVEVCVGDADLDVLGRIGAMLRY